MTDINLQDIDAVVRIIDAVSARGAFRGPELSSVGAVREKFAAYLQEQAVKQQAQQPAESVEEKAAEDEEKAAEDEGGEEESQPDLDLSKLD